MHAGLRDAPTCSKSNYQAAEEVEAELSFRDADLLAKVAEQLMYPGEALIPAACRLHAELMLVMHKMNAEYERMHPRA